MKLTNKYNLPVTIIDAIQAQQAAYSRGEAYKSITGLMNPPRIDLLTQKHFKEISEDVSDSVWRLMGSAVHVVLDAGNRNSHIKEERIFMEIDGKVISGALDVQEITDFGVEITDYKMTKALSVMEGSYKIKSWTEQLNCYAELVSSDKNLPITALKVCAILKDHDERQAETREGYPPVPIHMVDIEIWDTEKRREFIRARLAEHVEAEEVYEATGVLPNCTEEERWKRGDKWAVMPSSSAKRAKKVCDSENEAKELAETNSKFIVEHRPASAIRCERYCAVAPFCDQYQGEN